MINTTVDKVQAARYSSSEHAAVVSLPIRKGLLIDLDYATYYFVGTERDVNKGHRTGTVPFMAIEILHDGSKTKNRPTHDLESLFYVLLWICSNYSGPNNSIRNDPKYKDMPILSWVDNIRSLDQISDTKAGHISNEEHFTNRILDYYPPYFEDLKPCSSELRGLFAVSDHNNRRKDVTHDEVLVILRRTLRNLQPEYESECGEDHTAEEDMEDDEDEDEDNDDDDDGDGDGDGDENDVAESAKPFPFLFENRVIGVSPRVAITTYSIDGARSSSPCPQHNRRPGQ